ncbi:hypothetical protein PAXRUDRAFT_832698 [Paxillus rubicundulus Ve08.2h10]|uniref:Uncharacterized protein n=1 Tax=Paxillus rubicundulus Ve08.2h10 TaxID=930991 RepID=A0A0D0D0W8_9AGAM|nr:hypothetical protein PAXRUDRAFT_832698 [Paxillus rubicundulus Ve08.2h10]
MSTSFALMRGPTYLGFAVALVSYGATIGQLIHYARAFPSDKLHVKLLAFIVLCVAGLHSFHDQPMTVQL